MPREKRAKRRVSSAAAERTGDVNERAAKSPSTPHQPGVDGTVVAGLAAGLEEEVVVDVVATTKAYHRNIVQRQDRQTDAKKRATVSQSLRRAVDMCRTQREQVLRLLELNQLMNKFRFFFVTIHPPTITWSGHTHTHTHTHTNTHAQASKQARNKQEANKKQAARGSTK
jgi:hypothetical protein